MHARFCATPCTYLSTKIFAPPPLYSATQKSPVHSPPAPTTSGLDCSESSCTDRMSGEVTKIHAREILDSRGNPTVEVLKYSFFNFVVFCCLQIKLV